MAIDFFGVSISGRILQMGGGQYPDKTIELWTEQQSSIMTANLGALAFVSEINIKYKMGENAEIALVLTPPFEDGLRFLQSDIIRYGTGRLEVELAYTTGTFSGSGAIKKEVLPFTGFLQKPDVQIGQDITITLHALGVGYQLNLVGGVEDTAFPVGTTYADAIQKTLQKYVNIGGTKGLKIDHLYDFVKDQNTPFFKTPSDKVLSGKTTKPDAEVVPGVIWKGPRNDWWFVRETLSEFGYDLFIQGDQIYVVTKSFWIANNFGQSGPRKQFWLRGNVDPTRNMYPILSFQSPTEAAWLQPGLGTIVATDVDVNKKVDTGKVAAASADKTPMARTKKSVNPLTTIYNIVGLDPASILSKATDFVQAGGRLLAGDPADPAVVTQVNSHWTDLNMQSGINGQFNTIGVPDLVPGETIQVNGFDPREGTGGDPNKALFNGPYGVIEVNHKVGVGGWDTSFVAINNLNPEDFVAAAQQTLFPNAQTVASNEQPQPSDASGGTSITKTPQTQ